MKLEGYYYAPENAGDKWVILIHGYGHNHKHVYPYATSYLANGYNVLLVDQRAAGESEGEWLTMGAATAILDEKALPYMDVAAKGLTGYSLSSAAPLDSISAAKMPTLFIKGTNDSVENVGDNDGYNYSLSAESIAASDHYGHFVSINGGANADFITNEEGNNVTIRADAGNDTINNRGSKVTIYGGAGNDSINIANGQMTSVDAGSGNDIIINDGSEISIIVGKGNDFLNIGYSDYSSINGGTGNNLISIPNSNYNSSNYVVLKGKTAVEGFHTGWGNGLDTVYVNVEANLVDF